MRLGTSHCLRSLQAKNPMKTTQLKHLHLCRHFFFQCVAVFCLMVLFPHKFFCKKTQTVFSRRWRSYIMYLGRKKEEQNAVLLLSYAEQK